MKRAAALLAITASIAAPAGAQDFPTTPPRLGPAAPVTPPVPVTRRLDNGMTVMYVTREEVPSVQATLVIRGAGTTDDPAAQPGLASFTANMLDEGAGGKDALQLSDALDLLGAELSTGAGWDAAQVDLYVLKTNVAPALRLMADVVARPDFPEREATRLREERLTALARGRDDPGTIAGNAFQALVFGAAHPYGRFATTEATRTLDRARVAAFHAARYRPENATLILVGDVDPATMHDQVAAAFSPWRAAAPAGASPALDAPQIGRTVVYIVDRPGSAQSEIRIGHPGVTRGTPDYYALRVLNTILGGSFTSRLNQNLRETHGWSYGARSGYSMRQGAGPFTAAAAVQTNATDSSLVEFFRELNRMRDEPVSAEELDKAKRYIALGFPQDFETNPQVAAQFAEMVTYGLPATYLNDFVPRIMAVTAEDVRRVANLYVRPAGSVVVVVGDRATIEAGIRAANLGAVEIRAIDEFVK